MPHFVGRSIKGSESRPVSNFITLQASSGSAFGRDEEVKSLLKSNIQGHSLTEYARHLPTIRSPLGWNHVKDLIFTHLHQTFHGGGVESHRR